MKSILGIEILKKLPKKRKIVDAVILFADVMDSATISDILDPIQYDAFISEFQSVCAETIQTTPKLFDNDRLIDCAIRGDEVCLIICGRDQKIDIRIALTIAGRIKAAFLATATNKRRLKNRRNFFDIGIGIHVGRVTIGLRHNPMIKYNQSKTIKPEGYTINLAKRVESFSRDGLFSHITMSGDAKALVDEAGLQMAFYDMGEVVCKGILHRSPVYEVKSPMHLEESWPARIIQTEDELQSFLLALKVNRTSLWLIMAVAHYYFDKEQYDNAREYYEAAIRIQPDYYVPRMYLGRAFYRSANLASDEDRKLYLQQAADQLEQAIKSGASHSVTAHDFLAVVYRRLGEYNKAIECHRKALLLSPESKWARNGFAYTIAESRLMEKDANLEQAKQLVKQLLKDKEFSEKYGYLIYHTAGLVECAKNNLDGLYKAIEHLNMALKSCETIKPIKKKWEKTAEIEFHKAVTLHEICKKMRKKTEPKLLSAKNQFQKAIGALRNLCIDRHEPYWDAEAKQRMGEIDIELDQIINEKIKKIHQNHKIK